jgi:hypothetical protein
MKDVRHGLDLDTSAEVARIQLDLIRRMSSERRARTLTELCRMVDTLAEAERRRSYPGAPDREVFLRLVARRLGGDLARKAFPEIEPLLDDPR